jgi:GTP cyclohydrolase I
MNNKQIEYHIKCILGELGEDPRRPGLVETPKRVAKMFEEVFEGIKYSNDDIAKMYDKCFDELKENDLVVVDHIPIFSYCEHHLALMYNMNVHVAYVPAGKVIGLSKIARIAEMVGKRLQLQERIGQDIAEILIKILGTEDVMVVVEGEHSCMTARGVKSRGAKTKTATLRGDFKSDAELRAEVYSIISK